ncbi:MAG TPA: NAD-dependent epimerase/dehydratase family protein [Polyangiaceae bacterium]|nr:NAD-dependent epimerase/dehydratase family protein [Polyangiaceae bacterium]
MANPNPSTHHHETDSVTAQRPATTLAVAVTGIQSALGAALLADLANDSRVTKVLCIDLVAPTQASPKLAFESIDLCALEAQKQLGQALADHHIDAMAHLAFRSAPSPSAGYNHELESIGTMRVVQACLTGRVKKLVMGSQTWLYGANVGAPALLDEQQPPRARRSERYFADKTDAERDVLSFRAPGRGRLSTILRIAPVVDPTSNSHIISLLRDKLLPSVLGFDPMWQLTHLADAQQALHSTLFRETPAIVNIASAGAVPLSVARRKLGVTPLALPRTVASMLVSGLWLSGAGRIPPSMLDYLQYPCVADCGLARTCLEYRPKHNTYSILQDTAHLRTSGSPARSPA